MYFKSLVSTRSSVAQIQNIDDNSYELEVSNMQPGEKVECPDHTSSIQKLEGNSCKVVLNSKKIIQKI